MLGIAHGVLERTEKKMASITITLDGLTVDAVKTAENGRNGRERAIHAARILKAYCEACGDDCAGCFLETDSMRWCTARIPELWEIPE